MGRSEIMLMIKDLSFRSLLVFSRDDAFHYSRACVLWLQQSQSIYDSHT